MRFWGLAIFALLSAGAARSQPRVGTPPPNQPPAGNPIPRNGPMTPFPDDNDPNKRVIFISGIVVISDGTPLPERAKIERVCSNFPVVDGETDRKGHFSFELGRSRDLPDATVSANPSNHGAPFGNTLPGAKNMSNRSLGNSDRRLWGCELRAVLPGFRSDAIQLDTFHYLDDPNVGTIVLHRLAKVDGLTISVVSALAPKDARKAYEQGRQAEAKLNFEEAHRDFQKAVEVYPQYSIAWFEMGRIAEQGGHSDDARESYKQAITAEPKYLQPYEQLCGLALREAKWQELVDFTDQWLKLDPLNSSNAYYLSSIGNLQMLHPNIAEKNAREAVRMDPGKKNMRARYVLGVALAQNRDFTEAAEAIRSYLEGTPEITDRPLVEKQLQQIQDAAQEKILKADRPKPR